MQVAYLGCGRPPLVLVSGEVVQPSLPDALEALLVRIEALDARQVDVAVDVLPAAELAADAAERAAALERGRRTDPGGDAAETEQVLVSTHDRLRQLLIAAADKSARHSIHRPSVRLFSIKGGGCRPSMTTKRKTL